MPKIKITRKMVQLALLITTLAIGFLGFNNKVIASNLFSNTNIVGVVRTGAWGFGCQSQNSSFSVRVDISCQNPPVMLGIQILEHTYPYHQFSVTVTDPDGEVVPTDQYHRFLAKKFGAYRVVVVDLISGDTASCFGYVRPCKSKTQEEWANSKGRIFPTRITVGGYHRSLNFEDLDCATKFLPATGEIAPLPKEFEGLGGIWIKQPTCELPLKLSDKERIRYIDKIFDNPLLGEQLALSLNIWSDGGYTSSEPEPLGNVELCQTMEVLRVSDNSFQYIHIPPSVIDAIYPYQDMNGLMHLADKALAGDKNLRGTNLENIHTALAEVNKGFGSGGYFVRCLKEGTVR